MPAGFITLNIPTQLYIMQHTSSASCNVATQPSLCFGCLQTQTCTKGDTRAKSFADWTWPSCFLRVYPRVMSMQAALFIYTSTTSWSGWKEEISILFRAAGTEPPKSFFSFLFSNSLQQKSQSKTLTWPVMNNEVYDILDYPQGWAAWLLIGSRQTYNRLQCLFYFVLTAMIVAQFDNAISEHYHVSSFHIELANYVTTG